MKDSGNDYLLDTNVLIWLATNPTEIPPALTAKLADAHYLYVSAITGFEIAQKHREGKLPGGDIIVAGWNHLLRTIQAIEIPLLPQDAIEAGQLDWDHRDPFDRMLVAQARSRGLILVTKDRDIREYPGVITENWA